MTDHQPEPTSRREQTKAMRRSRIARAARELIKNTGETGFTMQELADAADVSLMTPYNLFGSKQQVMIAVLDEDLRGFEARLAKARGDELDKLFKTISVAHRLYASDETFYRCVFGSVQGAAPKEQRAPFIDPRRRFWVRLVQNAMDAGFLEARPDAILIGSNIGDLFYASVQHWLFNGATLPEFAIRAQYGMALLLLGFATPLARPRLLDLLEAASTQIMASRARRHADNDNSEAEPRRQKGA